MLPADPSVGRREVVLGLVTALAAAGCATGAGRAAAPGRVVRISRGTFAPEQYEAVRRRLDAAQATLVPAIRELRGCVHYFAAIDREASSMVNVSVWQSREDAQQMRTLAPMLALAEAFAREGVRFERPIVDYETLWEI